MGVDFYACHYCGDTFPDCGPYEHCEECGRRWCSLEYSSCADKEGLQEEETDADGYRQSSCSFCRNEAAEDGELLSYALGKLNMTRDELEKEYLSE